MKRRGQHYWPSGKVPFKFRIEKVPVSAKRAYNRHKLVDVAVVNVIRQMVGPHTGSPSV